MFFGSAWCKINNLLTATCDPPKRLSVRVAAEIEWRAAAEDHLLHA